MTIQENYPLKEFNTFRIDAKAKGFVQVNSTAEIKELISEGHLKDKELFILGGGSNTLFTKDFDGIVVRVKLDGIDQREDNDSYAIYNVASGENWDETVKYFVDKDLGGLENLSYIPGDVGAAPIQNIGAYGAEVRNSVMYVDAIDIETGEDRRFLNEECEFGYRDSIFKHELKNKYIVTNVGFKVIKNPILNTSYGEIEKELEPIRAEGKEPTIKDVREAVIKIRMRKLPDVRVTGTAGSFFKNSVISMKKYKELQNKYKDIPSYPVDTKTIKVPSAWFIDQLGWKGWMSKNKKYGIHKEHALIPVNYNNATGEEIYQLTNDIKASVEKKFGVKLEEEVNII